METDAAPSYIVRASTDPEVQVGSPAPSGIFPVQVFSTNLQTNEDSVLYCLTAATQGTSKAWAAVSGTRGVGPLPDAPLGAFPRAFIVTSSQQCPKAWRGTIAIDTRNPNEITLTFLDVSGYPSVSATFSRGVLSGGQPDEFCGLFELTIDPSHAHLVGAVVSISAGKEPTTTVGVWGAEAGTECSEIPCDSGEIDSSFMTGMG